MLFTRNLRIVGFYKDNWGKIALAFILLLIIVVNVRPGFVVLGNDNFSPELNPLLNLKRIIFSPAWRTYRIIGIPSDSEQADIFRTILYLLTEKVTPVWVVSQAYLFFTLFIANFSMGFLTWQTLKTSVSNRHKNTIFFFGGLFYLASLLTSWIYFFPVHLFVAAYAFLPFALWRIGSFYEKRTFLNFSLLTIALLFLTTSALTATMFFVCFGIILIFIIIFASINFSKIGMLQALITALSIIVLVLGLNAFWIFPFATYVKTNTPALRDSAIYRSITATTIETEAKYNTAFNTPRYQSSWIDTKENHIDYTFKYRDWYKTSVAGNILSFIPVVLAILGVIFIFASRLRSLYIIPLAFIFGWFIIKGINPPFGNLYSFFLDHFPTAAQVFRWQSSKIWPLLGVSIPILASIGILFILKLLFRLQKRNYLSFIFISIVALSMLVYVYPYFKGDLIRQKVFTKVPADYYSLSLYLQKTDHNSRMYVSPEANTLYFRNYSWGFWGSVVLNYILPNPIIEKALIAGSYQNEQAFTVINNAYYSDDPLLFTNALKLYKTSLILSDRNASTGDAGYVYNWEVEKKMVEDNPYFEKIWHQGKLSLYRIKQFDPSLLQTGENVAFQTNFANLNLILARQGKTSYYVDELKQGTIYPFALKFDDLTVSQSQIETRTLYLGKGGIFTYAVDAGGILEDSTTLDYKQGTSEVVMSPASPQLSVNEIPYAFHLPEIKYQLKNNPLFLSLDDQVIDERFTSGAISTSVPFSWATDKALFRSWDPQFTPYDILAQHPALFFCNDRTDLHGVPVIKSGKTKCGSGPFSIATDSVIEAEVQVRSTKPVQLSWCINSESKKSCLNKNVSIFVNGIGKAKTLLPTIIGKEDKLQVFLDFNTVGKEDSDVTIEKLQFNIYQTNQTPTKVSGSANVQNQSMLVYINKGDTISLDMPVIQGANAFPFRSDGALIPESTNSPFDTVLDPANKIDISEKGLAIINKDSNSNIFPRLSFVDPRGSLAMVSVIAENTNGVPVDVSLRDVTQSYKIWDRQVQYRQQTKALDVFAMPDKVESYYFEAFSTGFGPRESINTIKALNFQTIPRAWYSMKLEPLQPSQQGIASLTKQGEESVYAGDINISNNIIGISEGVSPNWKLSINGKEQKQSLTINGWEQGWNITEKGRAKVDFWPTRLVQGGYILLVVILLVVFGGAFFSARKILPFSKEEDQNEEPQKPLPQAY